MALRAAKADEDAAQGMCGQRFGAAAELPLGAERYVSAGSAGDLVAGGLAFLAAPNRVFNGVPMALRATEMDEDAGAGKHETGSAGDLVAGVLQGSDKQNLSRPLEPVNQAGHVTGSETVIDIHHSHVTRATVQHSEKRREPVEACAIADAGRHGDHRDGHDAADSARQCAFHACADDHDARFSQALAIGHEPVNTRHPDIVNRVDLIAHDLSGDLRFFGHRNVARSRAYDGDLSLAVQRSDRASNEWLRRAESIRRRAIHARRAPPSQGWSG